MYESVVGYIRAMKEQNFSMTKNYILLAWVGIHFIRLYISLSISIRNILIRKCYNHEMEQSCITQQEI